MPAQGQTARDAGCVDLSWLTFMDFGFAYRADLHEGRPAPLAGFAV
jgi:hypothetical protein